MIKLPALVAALALSIAPGAAAQAPPRGGPPQPPPGLAAPTTVHDERAPTPDDWIVVLDAEPLARYDGGVQGLGATAPDATGRELDRDSATARAYVRYLDDRQAEVLRRAAPSVEPRVEYRAALAGFAARLSDRQVDALRDATGVRRVLRERFGRVTQAEPGDEPGIGGSEPELLGLPEGLWKRLGGPSEAGRGTIVGVVDTGITPEHPSFADPGLEFPTSWDGACQGGQRFPTTSCNDKLIGARYFVDGFGRENLEAGAFLSPRDEAGHGTHVAGISAGDAGVDPSVGGDDLGVDPISGVAPAAHLAAYKACWLSGICSDVDVVAAIDAAVADGVDVINLSLGFPAFADEKVDPIQLAALGADAAGVVVVVAAGNSGEPVGSFGSIGSPAIAPWTTAVGATTGQRTFRATVRAARPDGTEAEAEARASILGPGIPRAELVDGAKVGRPVPGTLIEARNCLDVDAERVRGKVVLCDFPGPFQGIGRPWEIAKTVKDAGGVGIVLSWPYSEAPQLTWPLPTAVITRADGAALTRLLDAGPAIVSSGPGHAVEREADRMAAFSSRGPAIFTEVTGSVVTELLRPDVAAPGVDTLSAYAPETFTGHHGGEWREPFATLSGTSMASPMTAGAAALLTQAHPLWSPAAIRSALTTTARAGVTDTDGGRAGPDDAGGGRIDPTAAADADLVVEAGLDEYRRYAEGLDPAAIEGDLEPIAARDLNLPHLALPRIIEPVEVSRTFTNVGSTRASWTVEQDVAPDRSTSVLSDPVRFTLGPGQRRTVRFRIGVREGSAGLRSLRVALRNEDTGRVTRLPVGARNPGILDAPPAVRVGDAAADGERDVPVTVSGPVSGVAHGLVAPTVTRGLTTVSTPGRPIVSFTPLEVPEGAPAVIAQATPRTAGRDLLVALYRDGDGDGRLSQQDEFLWGAVQGLQRNEAAHASLPAGKYLAGVESQQQPETFDLRTWIAADPRPDDPEPAPGLVAAGDPLDSEGAPSAQRTLKLGWNGARGPEPLRGIVRWHAGGRGGQGERLGATVVEVAPVGR